MAAPKSSFLDKVLGRIGRLDAEGLQTVVQRLARERSFLETLFNTIEDGVLVADEQGRVIYFNQAVTRLIGLPPEAEDLHVADILPELDWEIISKADHAGGKPVVRHEFEVHYPRPRFLRLYAAPLDGEAAGSSGVALILHDATEARQKTFEAIESERVQALTLSRAVRQVEALVAAGERRASVLIAAAHETFAAEPAIRVDYIELVNWAALEPVGVAEPGALFAVAAWVGNTRLIDNAVIG